jgi:DtxR family Mn-dependent transcriptional regulator
MLTSTEENYLKSIYHLSDGGKAEVATNAIAEHLNTKAASVSDMIKRLSQKDVLIYEKYRGVNISPAGKKLALQIVRKHRLWEVFLVKKLQFHWDEVHDIAEQLEHIQSPDLINRLDEFLDFPKTDPHGDPIPDANGEIYETIQVPLDELAIGSYCQVVAVNDSNSQFLKYLDRMDIKLGARIEVLDKIEFDGSHEIIINGTSPVYISQQAAKNILVIKK